MNEFDDEYMKNFVVELSKVQDLYANLADQNTISDDEIKKLEETISNIRNIYNPDID
jgi:predicted transcriptional regulator